MRSVLWTLTVALVLLVAAGLAGCLGPPQVTAQQAQAFTDDVAWGLDPGAQLVFIAGLEGRVDNELLREMLSGSWFQQMGFETMEEDDTQESYWERIEQDGQPGNGRAELWVLHYASSDGQREYVFLVDRHKEILHQQERPWDDQEPIGEYAWDSDRAMRAAKQASAQLRSALAASNLVVGSGLHMDPVHGGPVWTISVMGGDLQGFRGAVVQLDAMNGEILHQDSESLQY